MPDFDGVMAATDHESALAAFLDAPEQHDGESEERPAPEPAPVAAAPTPAEPGAPAVQASAQAPVVPDAASAEIEALLNRPVPATDKFPKIFHGRPMRELVSSLAEKDRYITETRTQFAQTRDELIAAQATARILMAQVQARGGQTPAGAPPAATVDETQAFYERHGIKDPFRAFAEDPMGFMARVAMAARKDARSEMEPLLNTRFEPLENTVRAGQDERNLGTARSAVDRAFDAICAEDKITDPNMRKAARARFDALFGANDAALGVHAAKTGNIYDPAHWYNTYRGYEKAVGGFGPILSPTEALPPSGKANPPVSTRSTASVVGSGGKVVSRRRSEAVRSLLQGSGLPDIESLAAEAENEIADGIARGTIAE